MSKEKGPIPALWYTCLWFVLWTAVTLALMSVGFHFVGRYPYRTGVKPTAAQAAVTPVALGIAAVLVSLAVRRIWRSTTQRNRRTVRDAQRAAAQQQAAAAEREAAAERLAARKKEQDKALWENYRAEQSRRASEARAQRQAEASEQAAHLEAARERQRQRDLRQWADEQVMSEHGVVPRHPTERQPIPQEVKREVWRRDQGQCAYCGSQERLEFDHIVPVVKGGANTTRNLQLLCQTCNRRKGSEI